LGCIRDLFRGQPGQHRPLTSRQPARLPDGQIAELDRSEPDTYESLDPES
jgi:hypothetical protein